MRDMPSIQHGTWLFVNGIKHPRCILLVTSSNSHFKNRYSKHWVFIGTTFHWIYWIVCKNRKRNNWKCCVICRFPIDEQKPRLLDDMHRYLRDKIYETPFEDLVPLIVANALETNIIIIKDKLTRKVIREVKPFDVGNASHLMILYKKGDHYDACFPINDRANVNDLITTRPLGKDRRRKCVQDKVPKRSDICSSGQSKDKRAGKWSESHRRLENVKFGHINSRSLYPKKDEIEFIITKNDFDVFCISETWLSEHVKDNDISLPGYNICRKDRKHSLCIYVTAFVYMSKKISLLKYARTWCLTR